MISSCMSSLRRPFNLSSVLFFLTVISLSVAHAQDSDKTRAANTSNYSSPPVCRHCPSPAPGLTAEARKAEIKSATVLLSVTISAEGDPGDIQILKDPGFGLGEKAVKTVGTWKFKPAKDKDHKPVAAKIKIEVTFRRFD